jgi:hypothetical protein
MNFKDGTQRNNTGQYSILYYFLHVLFSWPYYKKKGIPITWIYPAIRLFSLAQNICQVITKVNLKNPGMFQIWHLSLLSKENSDVIISRQNKCILFKEAMMSSKWYKSCHSRDDSQIRTREVLRKRVESVLCRKKAGSQICATCAQNTCMNNVLGLLLKITASILKVQNGHIQISMCHYIFINYVWIFIGCFFIWVLEIVTFCFVCLVNCVYVLYNTWIKMNAIPCITFTFLTSGLETCVPIKARLHLFLF